MAATDAFGVTDVDVLADGAGADAAPPGDVAGVPGAAGALDPPHAVTSDAETTTTAANDER